MPVADQLSSKDFAAKVRQKYPGAYDDLGDDALVSKIVAKYPQYKSMVRTSTQPSMSAGTKTFEEAHPNPKSSAFHRFMASAGIPTDQGELSTAVQGMLSPEESPDPAHVSPLQKIPIVGPMFRAQRELYDSGHPYGILPVIGPPMAQGDKELKEGNYAGAAGSAVNVLTQLLGLKKGLMKTGEGGLPAGKTYEGLPVPKSSVPKQAVRGAMGVGDRFVERTAGKTIEGHKGELAKTSETNTAATERHVEAIRKMVKKQTAEYARAGETNEASRLAHQETVAEKARKGSQENAIVREQNAVALQDFAESKAKVEELNRSAQEAVTERADLAHQVEADSTQLGQQVKKLDAKVRRESSAKFEEVAQKVEHEHVPAAKLAQAVEHAEREIIRGSSENIKQFRELMNKGEVPDADTSHPLYNEMVARGVGGENLKFRDLQGYYTELGTKLASPDVPGDVYRALKYVREQLGAEMDAMAKRNGVGEQLSEAKSSWRQYQQTFHDMRAVSQGGSPVARMLRAQDPGYVAAPILSKAASRGIAQLKAYSPEAAQLAAKIAGDYQRVSTLPKKFTPKPLPEPPTLKGPKVTTLPEQPEITTPRLLDKPNAPKLKPDPNAPDVLGEIKEARRERILSQSAALKRINTWDLASVGSGLFELTRGQVPYAWSLAVLRHGIGALLDHPRVIEWLSAPDGRDFAVLNKLSTEDRTIIREGIENVYAHQIEKGQPLEMTAAVKSFLGLPMTSERAKLLSSAARARREGRVNVAEIMEQQANVTPLQKAKAAIREINNPSEPDDEMARRGASGEPPAIEIDEKTRASVSEFAKQARDRVRKPSGASQEAEVPPASSEEAGGSGSTSGAASDTADFAQAKKNLPNGTMSEWLKEAQRIKDKRGGSK